MELVLPQSLGVLPPWGEDPLSRFLAAADHNTRGTALHWPDVYEVQQRADGLLRRIGEVLQEDSQDINLGVPRMLAVRSYSAVLGAMRSAMSGQGFEAQPLLRAAIEQAWYALHVAKDSAPPKRAQVWWDREVSPKAKRACKHEFTIENVRKTHEALDAEVAGAMKFLYDSTIDFGGHPNERGVVASLKVERLHASEPGMLTVEVGILHPGMPVVLATLKAAVDVAIGVAKTVGLIYPDRFLAEGVDNEVAQLVRHSVNVFSKYGGLQRRRT